MNEPLNIGALPPVSASLADVLEAPARHLATAVDPDLMFGQVRLRGEGKAVSALPVLILPRSGKIRLQGEEGASDLLPGHMALQLGAGGRISWMADADCLVTIIADPRLAPAGTSDLFDLNPALSPSPSPSEEVLLTSSPRCAKAVLHDVPGMTFGLWAATPYARRAARMPVSEIMYLLEGQVVLSTPSGQQSVFGAGDVLIAPQGAELAWDNPVPVRKLFVSARHRGANPA